MVAVFTNAAEGRESLLERMSSLLTNRLEAHSVSENSYLCPIGTKHLPVLSAWSGTSGLLFQIAQGSWVVGFDQRSGLRNGEAQC